MSLDDADEIDFDAVVEAYRDGLLNRLRGFRPTSAALETWVDDEDPERSLLGMIESAADAGRTRVRIRLGARTAATVDVRRLAAGAGGLGAVDVAADEGGVILEVRLHAPSAPVPSRDPAESSRGRPGPHRAPRREQTPRERTPADANLPPCYTEALNRIVPPFSHEGSLIPEAGHLSCVATDDDLCLEVAVDPADHVVRVARFRSSAGAPWPALLERLCQMMEGTPLQEAGDHAIIRLEHRLRGRTSSPPVPGIVIPANAHPHFGRLLGLTRTLVERYRRLIGYDAWDNSYAPAASTAWRALTDAERLARLQAVAGAVCVRTGIPAEAARALAVDPAGRATFSLPDELPPEVKARLLWDLESELRATVEPTLEVYLEMRADRNQIRRL